MVWSEEAGRWRRIWWRSSGGRVSIGGDGAGYVLGVYGCDEGVKGWSFF